MVVSCAEAIVDPVVQTVRTHGHVFRAAFTHCVRNRGISKELTQRGRVVSIGDRAETGMVRLCVQLDDGREVAVGIEGYATIAEGQMVFVDWK